MKPWFVLPVQSCCLLRVPEHIVIASQQNLLSGKRRNKIEIPARLRAVFPPGMIPRNYEDIPFLNHSAAILLYLLFMLSPDSPEFVHRLIYGKSQVHVS